MSLHHFLELAAGFIGAAGAHQSIGQTQGRAEIVGRQFTGLAIVGDFIAVVALEFINFGHALA